MAKDIVPYTPGPWSLGDASNCGKNHAVCEGPYVIAKVTGFGYPSGIGASPTSDANARLICAAPELLEALKRIKSDYRDLRIAFGSRGTKDGDCPAIQAAEAAIAKATGAA